MYSIDIFYNTGNKYGKNYRVPHTIAFGYDLTISFQQGAELQLVQWDQQRQTYVMTYDPMKAGIKVKQNGYLELVVGI